MEDKETNAFFTNQGRLHDVVVIRSLAIVMVVAFHAYYMMMVPAHFPESYEMYRGIYFNINCLILQFRMPLFVMISGYLFSHLENDRGKYATFRGLLVNKFKRLILPFFVFATIFMISIHDFSWWPYYGWGYSHLWFIPMLFWCFIFTRLQAFIKFSRRVWWKIAIATVFFGLMLTPRIEIPLLAIPNFLKWYFWFYFGYQLYLSRNSIYGVIKKHKYAYTFVLLAIFSVGSWAKCVYLADDGIRTWYTELGNVALVVVIWYWVNVLLINHIDAVKGG